MVRTFNGRWTRSAVCIALGLGFRELLLQWESWVSGETSGKSMVWDSTFLLDFLVNAFIQIRLNPHIEVL